MDHPTEAIAVRIELDRLTKRYGAIAALDDVTLTIEPGQIVAVLGPNGAGKTTLLRCLSSIAAQDRGSIVYDGESFRRDRLDLRRRLGFLPDVPFVYPDMTVLRHIGLVLRLYEADAEGVEETVIDLLTELDLLPLAEMRLGTLSRGQSYKAALAAILAADPELLMFDEPFASGMDPRGLAAFRRRTHDAAGRGRTVLYTTQILELAESFSDKVIIIHRGRVHAFASVERLKTELASEGNVLEEIFAQLHEAPP
jgi:ABC-type multidrug transport system ATPase subunit